MVRHVIYIPGIGDHHSYGQDIGVQVWRLFGLKPHYLPVGWNRKEGLAVKQKRILELVNSLGMDGDSVALVGISAGASIALNTYAISDKVSSVVCICGKINNPETISPRVFEVNPDFEESMKNVSGSLRSLGQNKTANIMSIHPWRDGTVPPPDTKIIGAKEKTLPGWGHASGIFFGVILGSLSISRFIRSASR